MDAVLDWGLQVIIVVQDTLGLGVEPIFEAFSFLGNEEFFLLALPLLFWSIDFTLAARLGLLYVLSAYLNSVAKELLMQPRPGALDASLVLSEYVGFGLPSGHAQTAVVFWGTLAHVLRSAWAWVAAALLTFMIGLSRVYLGVHFPTDVIAGWLIGAVMLALYLAQGERAEQWLTRLGVGRQILLGVAASVLLTFVLPARDVVAATAVLAGLAIGLPITVRHVGFSANGPAWQRALRFVVGVLIVVPLFFGLRALFPAEGEQLYLLFRFVRYAAVAIWIILGAPWTFGKLGLAGAPS